MAVVTADNRGLRLFTRYLVLVLIGIIFVFDYELYYIAFGYTVQVVRVVFVYAKAPTGFPVEIGKKSILETEPKTSGAILEKSCNITSRNAERIIGIGQIMSNPVGFPVNSIETA